MKQTRRKDSNSDAGGPFMEVLMFLSPFLIFLVAVLFTLRAS